VCGKTLSVKSDPELSFLSRMVNFLTQHPFARENSESSCPGELTHPLRSSNSISRAHVFFRLVL
jgi:hypothetical protein